MKSYYRVTYLGKGIYNELKNNVSKEIWQSFLSSPKINWLPKPPSYAENNKSYFTEKGYKRFKQDVLPIIKEYLDETKIEFSIITNIRNIIYEDEYQLITDK